MRLTTIGTGTVAPSPTRVCSGHLVEAGSVRLLMDCGPGVTHRMASLSIAWPAITHLAITHFHPDHISDIPILMMAWKHGTAPSRTEPIRLIGPPGTADLLDRMAAAYGDWLKEPEFGLELTELPDGESCELGAGVTLTARKVPHTDESVAYCVQRSSRRIVYTGDTGPDPDLGIWAAGCAILLAECSLPDTMAMSTHLTPSGCRDLAGAAGPGLLALTHFYPPVELVDIRAVVAERFDGLTVLATDGWSAEIEDY